MFQNDVFASAVNGVRGIGAQSTVVIQPFAVESALRQSPTPHTSQADFLRSLRSRETIHLAQAPAPTGKTYLLGRAVKMLVACGYRVLVASPTIMNSSRLAVLLMKDRVSVDTSLLPSSELPISSNPKSSSVVSSTLDSLGRAGFKASFGKFQALVVDEADPCSIFEVLPFISHLDQGSKVILAGDQYQRDPVFKSAKLKLSSLHVGALTAFELSGVKPIPLMSNQGCLLS